MNKGVEILLERMEQFPDEFVDSDTGEFGGRWHDIVAGVFRRKKVLNDLFDLTDKSIPLPYLSEEEIDALTAGLIGIHRNSFTADIVEELATGKWLKEYTDWKENYNKVSVYETIPRPLTHHDILSDLLRQEIAKANPSLLPTEHPNKTRMDKLKKAGKYRK